jgi:hypothetical protein
MTISTNTASAFGDARNVIAEAFGVKPRGKTLRQLCSQLNEHRPSADYSSLVAELYRSIEGKCAKTSTSKQNWRWVPQTKIADGNKSPEVLLERAVAILAKNKHLPDWSNQIPAISGMVPGRQEKRAAVDLARLNGDRLELIELKWKSDTPVYAAFEIMLYGLAYIFCRAHLPYGASPTMKARAVSLQVLAPEEYFQKRDYRDIEAGLSRGFNAVLQHQVSPKLSGDFRFVQLPRGFDLPFKRGAAVKAACGQKVLEPMAQALCQAVERSRPLYT